MDVDDGNGRHRSAEHATGVHDAAAELAGRLEDLAATLAERHTPVRVRYGRGRLGNSFKRQSPEGFILDPASLQMLLPDGRLWTYSRSDSTRFPNGRYYDARTDYVQFAGNRTFPAGREFVFLGAVLSRYTFGFAGGHHTGGDVQPEGLCAIYGEGRAVRYVTADEAFGVIAESAPVVAADVTA